MKLYLQYLQKQHFLLDPKIKIINIFLIGMGMSFFSCTTQVDRLDIISNANQIDSIYLFTTNMDIFTVVNISPDMFYDFYQNNDLHKSTLITNESEIKKFIKILGTLSILNNYVYKDFDYKPVKISTGQYYLFNTSLMDVRSLAVIALNGNYYPIWISNAVVCFEKKYYESSDELRAFIKQYEFRNMLNATN
ncbi:MAG: hypothetical protein IJ650_01885 [Paludibacteraceae bacterium]|nr:hypothetical protein [Paludibacteraceae bacterium]